MRASDRLTNNQVYSREELQTLFDNHDATINNGVFPLKGYDSIFLFITEHKPNDRSQFVDRLDGDILYWQGQSKGRTDRLIINHKLDGIELLVFYRERVKQYEHAGFRYEGPFEYISHHGQHPTSFVLYRVASVTDGVMVEDALARAASATGAGQGFQMSAAARKALEDYSMARAINHFAGAGWDIDPSVAANNPFDLRCTRINTPELHVEVKGTTTTGAGVLLTGKEVEHAREYYPNTALFIVAHVEVHEALDGSYAVSGGVDTCHHPWRVDDGLLKPIGYVYRLPAATLASGTRKP